MRIYYLNNMTNNIYCTTQHNESDVEQYMQLHFNCIILPRFCIIEWLDSKVERKIYCIFYNDTNF